MKKAPTLKINGYEGGGNDPVHTKGEIDITHTNNVWVDTTSGTTYSAFGGTSCTWTFRYSNHTHLQNIKWSKTINNRPIFVGDTPEIIITTAGTSGAGNPQWKVRVKVRRYLKAWSSQTYHQKGNGDHTFRVVRPSALSDSLLNYGLFHNGYSFGSVGSPLYNVSKEPRLKVTASAVGDLSSYSPPTYHDTIDVTPDWASSEVITGSVSQGVGYIYDSDIANTGYMNRGIASMTVEANVTTVQDLITFFNSHGTLSYDTGAFSHPDIADGASLNGTFGAPWGQTVGNGTKNILDANLSTSGTLKLTDTITELEVSSEDNPIKVTYEWFTPHMLPFGKSGNFRGKAYIDASSSKAAQNALLERGPFYAPVGEYYCSILQENGSPYPDQTSCVAAGGAWVNTGAGSCSNGAYSDYTSCVNAGATWTFSGDNQAEDQYNEWRWKTTFMQKDSKNNITTGNSGDSFKLTLSVNTSPNLGTSVRYTNTGTRDTQPDLLNSSEISLYDLSSKGLKHINIDISNISDEEGFNTASGVIDTSGSAPSLSVKSTNGDNLNYFNSNTSGDYSAVIPLKEGHTFQAGDIAYFKDLYRSDVEEENTDKTINSISGSQIYREFLITDTTSTSITVTVTGNSADDVPISTEESHYFTIANEQPISNNLRAQIWRTKNLGYSFEGDPVYYLVEEIPVQNLEGSQQSYKDQFKDDDLGPAFEDLTTLPALTRHYPLPRGKYLSTVSNTLVIAGNPKSVGTLYKMEPGHPEIYTGLGSFFTVSADGGGEITGLGTLNKVLYVFQKKAINGISGDMATGQIRIDIISNANMGIGCESHHTIKEVKGRLNFLSEKGIYSVAPGTPVLEASALVAPLFDPTKYNFRK